MEVKVFSFAVKAVDAPGVIEGYASTFGNVDSTGDIIERGAFTKTLQEHPHITVFSEHRELIGVQESGSEDDKGLHVRGRLVLDVPRAAADYALAKAGALRSLSIGFRTIKDEWDRETDVRHIKEVRLFEWSLVAHPANEEAGITAIKSADQYRAAILHLRNVTQEELVGIEPELVKAVTLRLIDVTTKTRTPLDELKALLAEPAHTNHSMMEPPMLIEPDTLHSLRAVLHSLSIGTTHA